MPHFDWKIPLPLRFGHVGNSQMCLARALPDDPQRPVFEAFIQQRFYLGESIIIVALVNNEIIGFTQLFPSFSSVTLERLWILNDLYV